MIENNGNKPTKESELDITELLRKYMDEEFADETPSPTAETASDPADPENDDDVKEYGSSVSEQADVKPLRRRRMTAVRLHTASENETDADENKDENEIKNEDADEDVKIAVPETQNADSASLESELEAGTAVFDAVPAETETDDEQLDIFDSIDDFAAEEDVTESAPDESTSVFDFVEPGAKSFDHDIDIFAEFEEPEDELYGADADETEENPAEDAVAEPETASEEDGTIVFDAVSADDEEDFSALGSPAEENGGDVDDFDVNIMLALGMEDELHESIGEKNVTAFVEKQQGDIERVESLNRERSRLEYEYTSKTQTREVRDSYASARKLSGAKIVYSLILTLILAFFECHSAFGITLGGAFSPTLYPVVFIMVGLQLLFLVAAPAYKSVWSGLRDFFGAKPAPESIAAFALILNTLYSVVICFTKVYEEGGPVTFNLPVAVMFIMLYVSDYINVRREILSFGIVSSKKSKFALENLTMSESHLEHEAFSDMMDEDDDADDIGVLRVECADFVNDYFLRTNRYPNGRKFIGFIVPAAIVIAAAFFAFSYNGSGTLYGGMKAAVSTALVCMPVSVFYMFSHPFYMANLKAHEEESTIIGESSAEEYADAAIISFDDNNVFPSTGVNVRAINVFGNNRIDNVLYYAASVFCTVGGPLSDVFDIATRDIGYSSDVKLLRTLPGLLEAEVDGSVIAFGTIDALEAAGVRIPAPLEPHRNDVFEPVVSVMYMVKDGKFISRMLISYVVDADFEFILKQLDRGGMFIGLKTFDPNITEQFLGAQIKLNDYPIRIIRCKNLDDKTRVAETTGSGLVSKDSPKSVIQTVALCEKVLHARSVNTMLVVLSLFVSLVVAALSIIFGALTLSPIFISLYALAWIVPMFIVSKMII